jgi:hypothetical protein
MNMSQQGRGGPSVDYGQLAERSLQATLRIHRQLVCHIVVTLLLAYLAAMAAWVF